MIAFLILFRITQRQWSCPAENDDEYETAYMAGSSFLFRFQHHRWVNSFHLRRMDTFGEKAIMSKMLLPCLFIHFYKSLLYTERIYSSGAMFPFREDSLPIVARYIGKKTRSQENCLPCAKWRIIERSVSSVLKKIASRRLSNQLSTFFML